MKEVISRFCLVVWLAMMFRVSNPAIDAPLWVGVLAGLYVMLGDSE